MTARIDDHGRCATCGEQAAGSPWTEHGQCGVCFCQVVAEMQGSRACYRCRTGEAGAVSLALEPLDGRHLFCPRCGLVIFADPADRVQARR